MAVVAIRFHRNMNKIRAILFYGKKFVICMASSRQTLSSGFPTKRDSNQSPQLRILARNLKFHNEASLDMILHLKKMDNKSAD